jgi:hypothetical protein
MFEKLWHKLDFTDNPKFPLSASKTQPLMDFQLLSNYQRINFDFQVCKGSTPGGRGCLMDSMQYSKTLIN